MFIIYSFFIKKNLNVYINEYKMNKEQNKFYNETKTF